MKAGLIADSHDNLPMIREAVAVLERGGAKCLLHAGDFVAPFAVKELQKFKGPIYAVFGNNDGEKAGIAKLGLDVVEGMRSLELGGRRILLSHTPPEETAEFDVVVYGHTHMVDTRKDGPLVLNPGECGGWLSGRCTVALVDLDTLEYKIIEL